MSSERKEYPTCITALALYQEMAFSILKEHKAQESYIEAQGTTSLSRWNPSTTMLTLGDGDGSTEDHRVFCSAATFLGPILSKGSRDHSASQFPLLLFNPFSIPLIGCSMFLCPTSFFFHKIK